MKKISRTFVASLLFLMTAVLPCAAETEFPRNVQIVVDVQQAAFTTQSNTRTVSQSSQKQFLVVSEGLEGRIFIGDKLPYVTYYQNYLAQEGYLTGAITFEEVGSGLIVTARVLGDQIQVTLTPEISYRSQDGSGRIAVQRLSTSVRVPNGTPFEIGGNIARSEFESNFYRSASGQALQVVLTAQVL